MLSFLRGVRPRKTNPSRRAGVSHRRPHLEALEDRTVPTTFLVSNTLDSGPGSLRQAILSANTMSGADTVRFQDGLDGTIRLTSGQLTITDALTILGPNSNDDNRLTVSGNDASRVFNIAPGTTVAISGLRIANGLADGTASDVASTGGGILNRGSLSLSDVVLFNNRAVGDPSVVVPIHPLFVTVGGGVGGGVANFGSLTVTDSTFTGNLAQGADNADSSATPFPGPSFPGNGVGGAIHNSGVASVTDSRFTGNRAQAGDGGKGDFASIAVGGAINSDATLTVTGSTFRHNQALGGSDSISPFHNGHGLGGAIGSGSLLPLAGAPGATLEVEQSTFSHNQALGGDDNQVTLPVQFVSRADGPNNAYGGGILVFEGSAVVRGSTVTHNRAVAGDGGAAQNGSLGVGGGIFFFSFIGGVTATVEDSTILHNDALGGVGGDGLGGGLAVGSLGALFGAPGTATVNNTLVAHNLAQGSDGGNGQGGGIFNDAGSSVELTQSLVVHNRARAGNGATDGLGQGGGVFNDPAGQFDVDAFTLFWIRFNQATDAGDDVFGLLTLI